MKGGERSSKTAEKRATGGQQQTLEGAIARSTPYTRNSKRWEKLTNAITYCVAKDIMPLQLIEKPGFKQLIQAFDPQYEPPSRKYISNTAIPALYYKTRNKVASDVNHKPSSHNRVYSTRRQHLVSRYLQSSETLQDIVFVENMPVMCAICEGIIYCAKFVYPLATVRTRNSN